MAKFLAILTMVIITSCYFFPFEFTFLPGINTKMAMAGGGLILLISRLAMEREAKINDDFFRLSIWALVVSMAGLLSVVYNNTHDYTYVTYILSMLVWSSGAYVTVWLIRKVHGVASVYLVCNYLAAVSVMQCLLALLIDKSPSFELFVNRWVAGLGFVDLNTLEEAGRLYGVGASLDVAGSRFAVVLVMITYWMLRMARTRRWKILLVYFAAFMFIAIVGNMIARTTTVGLVLSLIYVLYDSKIYMFQLSRESKRILSISAVALTISLPILVYEYNNDKQFNSNLRFAFEGFFSLAEKGTWEVHSNDILKKMYVFPDNARTWIIGDGYIENPYYNDPYYVGPKWGGYYMATDVGYLRFIFYFGLIGLSVFCYFMFLAGKISMNRFKRESFLFVLLLVIHFTVWMKVSTDIFLVFALFLMIDQEENDEYEKLYLEEDL